MKRSDCRTALLCTNKYSVHRVDQFIATNARFDHCALGIKHPQSLMMYCGLQRIGPQSLVILPQAGSVVTGPFGLSESGWAKHALHVGLRDRSAAFVELIRHDVRPVCDCCPVLCKGRRTHSADIRPDSV